MSLKPEEEFAQYANHYRNKRSIYRFKVSLLVWVLSHVFLPLLLLKLAIYSPSTIDAAIHFLDRINGSYNRVTPRNQQFHSQ